MTRKSLRRLNKPVMTLNGHRIVKPDGLPLQPGDIRAGEIITVQIPEQKRAPAVVVKP